jgi:hypothetical protein
MAVCELTAERDVGRIARPVAAGGLTALMAVGSVAIWTVIPVAGLWIASQLSESLFQMGPIALLATVCGIPAAMAVAGTLLARAERLHMRLTQTVSQERVVPPWRRSLSDSGSVRMTVLERLMVASALMAVIAMVVWFFAFAGTSLPT